MRNNKPSGTKLALFDFDGTLADTLDMIGGLYNSHAHEYGAQTIDRRELPELRAMSYRQSMKKKGIKIWKLPRIIAMVRREIGGHLSEVNPHEGVIEMLENLKCSDIKIGILTSNTKEYVVDYLHLKNFPEFEIIASEKKLFGKQKAMRRIMKSQGLRPSDVVYVGDEPRDITASRKARIAAIGVTWGLGGRAALERVETGTIVDTVKDLESEIRKQLT